MFVMCVSCVQLSDGAACALGAANVNWNCEDAIDTMAFLCNRNNHNDRNSRCCSCSHLTTVTMSPPRQQQACGPYAKAEQITHDAEHVFGAGHDKKWVTGTVVEVVDHRPSGSKQSTACIIAKCKIGNKECQKSIPLQSLKAPLPDAVSGCPTAEEAGVRTNNENANPNTGNDNGAAAAAAAVTATTTTRTPSPPPLGGANPPTPPSPVGHANDGRAWHSGNVLHDINGPTAHKMWKMTCPSWTGNEYTEGYDSDPNCKLSELDCFMATFPKTQLNWVVERLCVLLLAADKDPTTLGELLRQFDVLILITRFKCGSRAEVWSETPRCKRIPVPAFGKTGMSRDRFEDLWRCMEWSYQPYPCPDDTSSEHWRWHLIQDFVDWINGHRASFYHPSDIICTDEPILRWHGLGGSWLNKGLPMCIAIDRNPEDGAEIQHCCCGKRNIMMRLKMVKSSTEEDALRQAVFVVIDFFFWHLLSQLTYILLLIHYHCRQEENGCNHGCNVLHELVEPWVNTNCVVGGDWYFASVQAAIRLFQIGLRFIGVVKTASAGYPMAHLSRKELPDDKGNRHEVVTDYDTGCPLLAFAWSDPDQRCFISTCSSLVDEHVIQQTQWKQVDRAPIAEPERRTSLSFNPRLVNNAAQLTAISIDTMEASNPIWWWRKRQDATHLKSDSTPLFLP